MDKNLSFDGLTVIYTAKQEHDDIHFNGVISNLLKYNQLINITESEKINYFKL
ncbi:hypothetical protein [Clostridium novyi]|uniref:hypothetical protein n=1 Tax=Clostridium novyi TaxID=1542 RepID=UPI0016515028|nr:hypothetical protein [Clostridium novyi]